MQRVILSAGLGNGDETKGATVHWLCGKMRAHTVVRTGGPQALHTVITGSGKEHTFSQFGSGTFCGARTFLSRYMIVDPYALINEGRSLQENGVSHAFELMYIDENALVITPHQAIANRLREFARGNQRHGSVGIGVGETIMDSEFLGEGAVRIKDLGKPWLGEKIDAIRKLKIMQMKTITDRLQKLRHAHAWLDQELTRFFDATIVDRCTSYFHDFSRHICVVDSDFLADVLSDGVVIFESSQGVLLDQWHGFFPYVTRVNPMIFAAQQLLADVAYAGDVQTYGIIRAYHTRHGSGPFVTEDATLSRCMPDVHNRLHTWQGAFRVGYMDLIMLRYAIAVSGGCSAFDGMVVSCLDRLQSMPSWRMCNGYRYGGSLEKSVLRQFFHFDGDLITDIIVRKNTYDGVQRDHQRHLGEILCECRPVFMDMNSRDLRSYKNMIVESVHVPIIAESHGPTESDRAFV